MKGLIFVYAATLVGVIGALYRPYIGLYVYVLFATLRPRFLWTWADGFADISFAVGVAMLVGWAMRGFGRRSLGRGAAAAIALLGYGVWSGLSSLQAQNEPVAQAALVNLSKIVLPFLVGVTTLRGESHARALCWIIVLSQAYISLQMNLSYLDGYNRAQEEGFGGMDNNCFAISLVVTLGPAIALSISSRRLWQKAVGAVSTLLILHTTLLTFSRGAMVALLVMFVTAIVIAPKRVRYLGPIIILGLIALRLTGPELMNRYRSSFVAEEQLDASAKGRVELWKDCLLVVADYPLFGIGPDNFPFIADNYGWKEGKQAHSVWFQLAAEVGIPGVLFLLVFYLAAVKKLWPVARRRDPALLSSTLLAGGVILSIVGFMISAQFVTLQGLEVPYYVTMAGLILVNSLPRTQNMGVAAPSRQTSRFESTIRLPPPRSLPAPASVGQQR